MPTPDSADEARAVISQAGRGRVVAAARAWLGTPYRHNASTRAVGADCLGLLRGVYRELYGAERTPQPPAYTPDWGETPNAQGAFPELLLEAAQRYLVEKDFNQAQNGDVVLFRMFALGPIKHCAILTSPTHMIHAYSRHAVCEVPISSAWRRHITHTFSFPPLPQENEGGA